MVKKKRPFKKDIEDDFPNEFDEGKEEWEFGFPSSMFGEFEEQFRKMQEWMNHIFKDAMSENLQSPEEGGPYVYGWSLRVGPDGKPHYEEFGNVPNMAVESPPNLEKREPLLDVIEGEETVSVTAEIPSVSKEDIILDIVGNIIAIEVDKEEGKYYKEIELPCEVDADSVKTSYQNGVFDIELKKVKQKKKDRKTKN